MSKKYVNYSGVPLGGIGAGKIEFCPDGAFRNLTIGNSTDVPVSDRELSFEFKKEGVRGCFLAAYVEGFGAVALKEAEEGTRTLKPGDIEYNGHFPIIDASYPDADGVGLSLEAFSSLDLDDDGLSLYKDSSLPAACFRLKAKNRSSKSRYVSFGFSWFNSIGMGGYPKGYINDRRDNCASFCSDGPFKYLLFGHTSPKPDRRLEGGCCLGVGDIGDAGISYMIWPSIILSLSREEGMWNHFAEDGRLPDVTLPMLEIETDICGALAAGKILAPGETLEVPFIFAWYFPERTANKRPGVLYRNIYARWFSSPVEVALYFQSKLGELYQKTVSWQERFYSSNLPVWFSEKLINDIFTLYTNSLYFDDLRFSSSESPTDMCGCMGTIDQRAASGSIYEMCFPALSEAELRLFADQQVDEACDERYGEHWDTVRGEYGLKLDRLGAIRHETGWDEVEGGRFGSKYWANLHWPDLCTVFILQAYEHFIWTGDRAFLVYIYPKVKLALEFERRLDQDGDGIPDLWGPGCNTYDNVNFPYYGASPFIASLYMAALKAAEKMACLTGDKAYAAELPDIIGKVLRSMEDKLWSEELGYYLSWTDSNWENWQKGERPHADSSHNCLVAQLAGQWFANMLDLGGLLDGKRVARALESIRKKNVDIPAYCPANEVTSDNSWFSHSWPYYAETYYAANAIYEGDAEGGLAAVEKIYKAMYTVDGSPWDAPLVWGGSDNSERGWGRWYMSNPASWYVLLALTGIKLNVPDGILEMSPSIPERWGMLKDIPVFMPLFRGTLSCDRNVTTLKVGRLIRTTGIKVNTLVIGAHSHHTGPLSGGNVTEVKLNGKAADFEASAGSDGKIRLALDFTLSAGDILTVIIGQKFR